MDGQGRRFKLSFLVLSVLLITQSEYASATLQNENSENNSQLHNRENDQESPSTSATEPKASAFPNHLDISTLQNMPLIVLHPRTPINLQMLPGDNIASLYKSLNPSKIFELLQSATGNVPVNSLHPSLNQGENREARNRNIGSQQSQPSTNRPVSSHSDAQSNIPALPRSLLSPHSNNGLFQRVRGSFSNMFPMLKPSKDNPFHLSLPTFNLPVFLPQQNVMQGTISPFALNSLQQFQSLPWRQMNFHTPSVVHLGDLATEASHLSPLRMMMGNPHMNRFRPGPIPQLPFNGDLATSGSTFIPRRVVPPSHLGFGRFLPPVQRHKPLFNNIGGLQAASMEISNAFADFTDSKEHGPEVTQRFGSVGHSINNFLQMMGLGSGLNFGDVGGFGGGADLAAMDSSPIARSLDFYPGYGNQAHMDDFDSLDDIEDFPIFQQDITEEFMKKMNLTNATAYDDVKKDKEVPKKEATPTKVNMESMEKSKVSLMKGPKDKSTSKPSLSEEKDISYAKAAPFEKMPEKDKMVPEKHVERPSVNYKIPPIHSTVAPHERKQPIAIYQNFGAGSKMAPKPPTYAPAQAMPNHEKEENPNKLVDDYMVRQWRLIHSGQGYVEKRPVPIVDVLQTPTKPESLKVLQKVLTNTGNANSSS